MIQKMAYLALEFNLSVEHENGELHDRDFNALHKFDNYCSSNIEYLVVGSSCKLFLIILLEIKQTIEMLVGYSNWRYSQSVQYLITKI